MPKREHLDSCASFCTNDGYDDEPPLDRCPETHACWCQWGNLSYANYHYELTRQQFALLAV